MDLEYYAEEGKGHHYNTLPVSKSHKRSSSVSEVLSSMPQEVIVNVEDVYKHTFHTYIQA